MTEQQLQGPLQIAPDQTQTWRNFERNPISLQQAVDLVLADRGSEIAYKDDPVNGIRSWAFGDFGGNMAVAPVPLPGRPMPESPLVLRNNAYRQLCSKIGAPADYIRNLPAKLQIACMNYGMTLKKDDALFRRNDGEIRAIVSDRYAAVDDPICMETVFEAIERIGIQNDIRCRSLATGPHMVMRLTIPTDAIELKKNDVIEYGFDFGNSELGLRSVQVCPVTWRLVCTNGMRAWKSEATHRMRHVGDPARLAEQLADAIPVAIAEARGDLDRWRKASEILIDNALDEINGLRGFGLSKKETREVGRILVGDTGAQSLDDALKGFRTSGFDIANAITEMARDRVAVDSRLANEEIGHRYLSRIAA